MEDLLKSVWLQGGALGLLGVSGWAAWFLERRRCNNLQDKLLDLLQDNTKALTIMNERLK